MSSKKNVYSEKTSLWTKFDTKVVLDSFEKYQLYIIPSQRSQCIQARDTQREERFWLKVMKTSPHSRSTRDTTEGRHGKINLFWNCSGQPEAIPACLLLSPLFSVPTKKDSGLFSIPLHLLASHRQKDVRYKRETLLDGAFWREDLR